MTFGDTKAYMKAFIGFDPASGPDRSCFAYTFRGITRFCCPSDYGVTTNKQLEGLLDLLLIGS